MKARVISTRRVVDVVKTTRTKIIQDYFGCQNNIEVVEYYDGENHYTERELEFDVNYDPDYWTRLEHQYAGMAMNALLLTNNIRNGDLEGMRECNTNAMAIAYALVEKLKKKEERK